MEACTASTRTVDPLKRLLLRPSQLEPLSSSLLSLAVGLPTSRSTNSPDCRLRPAASRRRHNPRASTNGSFAFSSSSSSESPPCQTSVSRPLSIDASSTGHPSSQPLNVPARPRMHPAQCVPLAGPSLALSAALDGQRSQLHAPPTVHSAGTQPRSAQTPRNGTQLAKIYTLVPTQPPLDSATSRLSHRPPPPPSARDHIASPCRLRLFISKPKR